MAKNNAVISNRLTPPWKAAGMILTSDRKSEQDRDIYMTVAAG